MNSQNKINFNVIIAGSRNFSDYNMMKTKLDIILSNKKETHIINIISGNANGADKLGERYANDNNYNVIIKPAKWDLYGKSAGYKRNSEMAEIADALIAFWDGSSKGTKHMIDIAKNKNLLVRVIEYNNGG